MTNPEAADGETRAAKMRTTGFRIRASHRTGAFARACNSAARREGRKPKSASTTHWKGRLATSKRRILTVALAVAASVIAPGFALAQDRPDVDIRIVPGDASPPSEPELSPADIVQIVDRGSALGVDTTATTSTGKLAMVEKWLARGGDPNAAVDVNGATVMHWAAVFDAENIAILEKLIAHGGECDRQDSFGQTPLHFAAAQEETIQAPGPASVRLLVGCGADPNRRDGLDRTPLHALFASVRDFVGMAGVGPKNFRYGGDAHADRFLKGGASREVARALIEAGADPNVRDVNGQTPLAMAVRGKETQIGMRRFSLMELLLGAGADPDIADNAGVAPLVRTILSLSDHTASGDEAVRVIRTLLQAGADPDLRDGKGDTALVHAARYRPSAGREEYGLDADIAALLAGGADPCLAGADGKLPWELAADDSRGKRLLREAGGYRDLETGQCAGAALAAAAGAEKALGLDRDARRRIQAALAARGFDPGAPDGIFGPRTRAAIRAWQADAGADRPTGYLSRADVDALLGAAVAAAPGGDGPPCAGTGEAPCWQAVENRPGCFIWNPRPHPGETMTWSGECLGGRPHGAGETVWRWREDGERRTSSSEGEYRRGIRQGHWRVRTGRGENWEGPYVDGKRHGWFANIDSGGQRWIYFEHGDRVGSGKFPECCVIEIDRAMRVDESGGAERLRIGPGPEFETKEQLPPGARVRAVREVGDWLWVEAQEGAGFVRAARLEEAGAAPAAGTVFRDCPNCPEMVVVPAGNFMMGSSPSEERRADDEGPVHRVAFASPFAVGVHEVTFAEWDACVSAGGCGGYRPDDVGWGRGSRPVVNVSWDDAQSYVGWLSRSTGEDYRLLSESEWEYVARAGTSTRYWWGNDIGRGRANCGGCGSRWDDKSTAPVGSFAANAFGLHDVHGNVWEWTGDCWNESYDGAPGDGSAWKGGDCSRRVIRGGSWDSLPRNFRSASRNRGGTGFWVFGGGFRVARTFTP